LIVALAGAVLAQTPYGPGEYEFLMDRPEGQRHYWVYVPEMYNKTQSASLLFAFHGLGGDCHSFGSGLGFQQISDQYGFIYVYPCGTENSAGDPAWNTGTCCVSDVDDMGFVRGMVANLTATFTNVDPKKVFSTGFSNGGFMSEVLACQVADLFRAVAGVSGVVEMEPGNAEGEQACDAAYAALNKPVSVLHVHGNADVVVPWDGNPVLGFPPVPDDFVDWSTRNKCQGDPVNTFTKGAYSNQVYKTCNGGTTIELVKNEGGGHEWPSDGDFDATAYIWQYFQQFM